MFLIYDNYLFLFLFPGSFPVLFLFFAWLLLLLSTSSLAFLQLLAFLCVIMDTGQAHPQHKY